MHDTLFSTFLQMMNRTIFYPSYIIYNIPQKYWSALSYFLMIHHSNLPGSDSAAVTWEKKWICLYTLYLGLRERERDFKTLVIVWYNEVFDISSEGVPCWHTLKWSCHMMSWCCQTVEWRQNLRTFGCRNSAGSPTHEPHHWQSVCACAKMADSGWWLWWGWHVCIGHQPELNKYCSPCR